MVLFHLCITVCLSLTFGNVLQDRGSGCITSHKTPSDHYSYGQPLTVVRHEGYSVTFTCHSLPDRCTELQWSRNGQDMSQKTNEKYEFSATSLTLLKLTVDNSGLYRCQKTLLEINYCIEFRLIIFTAEPQHTPEIDIQINEQKIITADGEEDIFEAQCIVTSNVHAVVQWVEIEDNSKYIEHGLIEMGYDDNYNIKNQWTLWTISVHESIAQNSNSEHTLSLPRELESYESRFACMAVHPVGIVMKVAQHLPNLRLEAASLLEDPNSVSDGTVIMVTAGIASVSLTVVILGFAIMCLIHKHKKTKNSQAVDHLVSKQSSVESAEDVD